MRSSVTVSMAAEITGALSRTSPARMVETSVSLGSISE